MNRTETLEFITPLFSRGITEEPEIRAASIRGQLHWWFRALGGSWEDEAAVFGRVGSKSETRASRLVVRVKEIDGRSGNQPTLPHKRGGYAAPKSCFLPGTRFTVEFFLRRGGLSNSQVSLLQDSLEMWLRIGALGLRATRGAGAHVLRGSLPAAQDFANAIYSLRQSTRKVRVAFLNPTDDTQGLDAERLRQIITDTLGGPGPRNGANHLRQLHYPLGHVGMGRTDPGPRRKTSPLRLRPVRVQEGDFIVAVWDARQTVTGNRDADLQDLIRLLTDSGKPLGPALAAATFL